MDKSAKANHPIHEIIEKRWSPRSFNEEAPSPEKLRSILEAMRWAPSSYNEQPWRIILGVKGQGETYDNAMACLSEWNQKWAQSAPVIMIICAKTQFSKDGAENKSYAYDAGQAAAYLTFQLTAEGLYAHQIAGILPDKVRESFGIPEGFEPLTGMAVGEKGELDRIPEGFHPAEVTPRSRKPLAALVYGEGWGNSHELVR